MANRHHPIEFNGKIIDFPYENPAEENIPEEELHQNLARPITERTKRLKSRCRWKHATAGEFVDEGVRAGIERMRLITEAHKQSEGKPQVIRRALGLANILNKCTVILQEDELIIGYHAEHPSYVPLYPELAYMAVQDYIQSPKYAPLPVEEAMEINEYWKKYSLQSQCEAYFTEEELFQMYQVSTIEAPEFATGYNSIIPPYETVLEDGVLKRIELAEQHIKEAMEKMAEPYWNAPERLQWISKIDEWKAMIIAGKAVIAWARRHARLCKIVAEHFETNPKRKDELLMIADICQRVPAEPSTGLRDAMQSKWFTYLICHAIDRYASGYAQKEDKLCWPYYKASVIEKTFQPMTHEDAVELFECERLKISEHGAGKSRGYREIFPGSNDLFILTIGGLNRDGSDGCNDCTDAILEAARNIRTTEPSIVFRWHPKGREKTKRRVFECIRDGLGYPSIKHDGVNTAQMLYYGQFSMNNNGATPEEAHDWVNVLCMSPGLCGRRKSQKTRTEGGGAIFPAKIFEVTLNDGFDWSYANAQLGPHTGDPRNFKTFEDLWEAFRIQYRYACDLGVRSKDVSRYFEIRQLQMPFVSMLDDGCMELGMDAMELSEQPNGWKNPITSVVAGNSLVAIKKFIYDEKKYAMDELLTALHCNWEGYEEMRRDFLNAPKWGNDNEYADAVIKRYYEDILAGEMRKITNYSAGPVMPVGQAVGLYMEVGARTGPTPDGRYGGEAADDGGISPYMGTDKKGPTAVLRSVSRVDSSSQKANLLNQRLSVPIMRSKHGFKIWKAYMSTWYDLNIDHVQFNVVSTAEMRAAQKEPEKHQDLIVRVAGFSARFVDISKYGQETIIARTEQDFGPEDLEFLNVGELG
ncbi:glycyl radical protein [Desulfoscipio gibsoniae]|uniref:Pyruvate-formate lyase n=1 Tax=Desulfoscipio gibsoniae DSM 7213 TaxID=767817 RepID=R4KCB7_9FIRM|nr:glycyl radical protein [Desulfoscipio gibsoniae]AGL00214.1 pyruvate-formate lyase [Desulfoscipio gibsoniae DSM 7213]